MTHNKTGLGISVLLAGIMALGVININGEITSRMRHTEIDGTDCYIYEVKKGESLYGISRKFAWDYDELLKFNPEATGELKKGEKIYYPARKDQYLRHEVSKGETVYSISSEYKVPLDSIYKYNPSAQKGVKKGDIIILQEGLTQKKVLPDSALQIADNELTGYEGDLNMEIFGLQVPDAKDSLFMNLPDTVVAIPGVDTITAGQNEYSGVRLAVILDEAKGKKDIDFMRGVFVALNQMKEVPYTIDMKVIDGKTEAETIMDELSMFIPNLIFTTADKTFPDYLLDYASNNDAEIVNVFYLKANESNENESIIQVLPPSPYFNDIISSWLYNENDGRKFYIVGSEDPNDGIGAALNLLFENKETLTPEGLASLTIDPMKGETVMIYSTATKKEDIQSFFTNLESFYNNNPGADYMVVGRSNWIASKDEMKQQFEKYGVYVPSRVWLDVNSSKWADFSKNYSVLFQGVPVRSIPNYSATGYDMATYFIPLIAELNGDYSHGFRYSEDNLLQTDFELYKENNESGYQNGIAYLIKFLPIGGAEKIIVK